MDLKMPQDARAQSFLRLCMECFDFIRMAITRGGETSFDMQARRAGRREIRSGGVVFSLIYHTDPNMSEVVVSGCDWTLAKRFSALYLALYPGEEVTFGGERMSPTRIIQF